MKGCRRVFFVCLILGFVGLLLLVGGVGYTVSLGPPEMKREVVSLNQDIQAARLFVEPASEVLEGDETAATSADEVDSERYPDIQGLNLQIELEEGEFIISRGNPGEGIRIEADYDSGIYALEQVHRVTEFDPEQAEASPPTEEVSIRFRSKYSFFRRLLTMGDEFEPDNQVKIFIPPDVPIKLTAKVSVGESNLDLSGLALNGLDLDMTLGEHEVRFDEPNRLAMQQLQIYVSKGEFRALKLGNAQFQEATVRGSMGEVGLDLTGQYTQDARVQAGLSMGSLQITVPDDIHCDIAPTTTSMGESHSMIETMDDIPEDAPTLTLETKLSMGELSVRTP